jgi:hypothetical protein
MKSPSAPFRPWATRLSLLVACVASLATSYSDSSAVAQLEGKPLTLRTDAPTATRHLRVQISAPEPSAQSFAVNLTPVITATWKPDAVTSSPSPLIRARLLVHDEHDGWSPLTEFSAASSPDLPSASSATLKLPEAFFIRECTVTRDCEWSIPLEIELQPRGAAGAVDVQWSVSVEVSNDVQKSGDYIEDLAVTITEP